jgi:adenylate cyclase class IV
VTYVEVPEISGAFLEIEIVIGDAKLIDTALCEIKKFAKELSLDDSFIEKEFYTDAVRKARSQGHILNFL